MRIWFKIYENAHLIKDETIENYEEDTRTHKVFEALEQACNLFDLGKPIWLESNIAEFQKRARTQFKQDNFIEEIDFDYLEMQILEEDW